MAKSTQPIKVSFGTIEVNGEDVDTYRVKKRVDGGWFYSVTDDPKKSMRRYTENGKPGIEKIPAK